MTPWTSMLIMAQMAHFLEKQCLLYDSLNNHKHQST